LLLKPLEMATKEISGDHYVIAGIIIPLVYCIRKKMNEFNVTSETANALKTFLSAELTKRFCQIELMNLLTISTILDPRYYHLDIIRVDIDIFIVDLRNLIFKTR
jgi:hypothetical protein